MPGPPAGRLFFGKTGDDAVDRNEQDRHHENGE
jgi:hypothetical protein